MKVVMFMLWFISFIVWCIYAIRTVIEIIIDAIGIKENTDYLGCCLKMNIALIVMLIFKMLINIVK